MFTEKLIAKFHPCDDALSWARGYPEPRDAWEACSHADWLLWICAMLEVDRRLLMQAVCLCVRMTLPYLPPLNWNEQRKIEIAEAWARGEADTDEVKDFDNNPYLKGNRQGIIAYRTAHIAYCTKSDVAFYASTAILNCSLAFPDEIMSKFAKIIRNTIPWESVEPKIPK